MASYQARVYDGKEKGSGGRLKSPAFPWPEVIPSRDRTGSARCSDYRQREHHQRIPK
jgi:hypothetical protein